MLNVRLESGEEVLYQTERAVLTNKRLLASLDKKSRNHPTDEADLRDISGFQKLSGGQESRMKQGGEELGYFCTCSDCKFYINFLI